MMARKSSDWTGVVDLAPTWALYVGSGGATHHHAHLAHKLVIGLKGRTRVAGVAPLAADAWLVMGREKHAVFAEGDVLLLFLDAGSFGAMTETARDAIRQAVSPLRSAGPDGRVDAAASLAARLPPLADARVRRASAMLRDEPGLEIGEIATRLGISATRLTHLFAGDPGFAPRHYRTWGTLRRALALMAKGRSLTDVAHEAGFADAAHMSRTFSAMLGVPPSVIAEAATIRLRE
jgi:AraC-like DNA-binding protein